MDVLGSLLNGPRAKDAFLLRLVMASPWSLRIEDEAPLAVVVTIKGVNKIRFHDGDEEIVRPGDVSIIRGPDHYVIGDSPGPPMAVIDRDQRCISLDGASLVDEMRLGVRSWGNSSAGESVSLVGAYGAAGEVSARLLAALPRLITVPGENNPLIALLSKEIGRAAPGQEVVLDRLLDLILIDSLRRWFSLPGSAGPRWIAAQSDPVVGHALSLIHHNPQNGWTVAGLAVQCAVSRAALARRFTDLVGEPPMAYLANWRLAMAADLLAAGDHTLDVVARQVGYGSAFALSTAFKRVRGISPREYRRSHRG